jgi:hypothetical protein
MSFAGFFKLNSTMEILLQTRNLSMVPVDADALPTYRIYGQSGSVNTGSVAFKDSGTITGATNAAPIVITSANHKLTTGTRVTISGVGGNTAANGSWTITSIDANTFSLTGSSGNGNYTSGGTWRVTGLYALAMTASEANGLSQDDFFTVAFDYQISATSRRDLNQFGVV